VTLFFYLKENDTTLDPLDSAVSTVACLVSVYRDFKKARADLIIECTFAPITLTYYIDQSADSLLVNREKFEQSSHSVEPPELNTP
jgi:hypothetical protein